MEMLVTAIVLTLAIAATARLLLVGKQQQQLARDYSVVQTDVRTALRRLTRAARHGYQVVLTGTTYTSPLNPTTFPSDTTRQSSATQLVVCVPEPAAYPDGTIPTRQQVELRFYLSNGSLYEQSAVGGSEEPTLDLLDGVTSLQFNYFQTSTTTSGTSRTAVDSTPDQATEVQISLTALRGSSKSGGLTTSSASARVVSTVLLRNKIGQLIPQ